ncbi:hypothetical protein C8R45DRAFT_1105141 [Mycena sanguinolenta]|nr:hypothetical protein C8R45DRAFT_1105141 [Mycena sanguinolenta]
MFHKICSWRPGALKFGLCALSHPCWSLLKELHDKPTPGPAIDLAVSDLASCFSAALGLLWLRNCTITTPGYGLYASHNSVVVGPAIRSAFAPQDTGAAQRAAPEIRASLRCSHRGTGYIAPPACLTARWLVSRSALHPVRAGWLSCGTVFAAHSACHPAHVHDQATTQLPS